MYVITIVLAILIVGYMINKRGSSKKFCEIWSVLSTLVYEIESVVVMIEKEIPDNTKNKNLRTIDLYCKKTIKLLRYAKLFLQQSGGKNAKN